MTIDAPLGPEDQSNLRRIDDLLAIRPDDTGLLCEKAALLRRAGQPQAALALLSAKRLQHPDSQLELALASHAVGDGAGSTRLIAALLQHTPNHGPALHARVDLAMRDGMAPDTVLPLVDDALQHLPRNVQLALLKGRLLRQLQRHKDSVAHLQKFLARRPDTLKIQRELAVAYRMAGDASASLKVCGAILQKNPRDRGVWQSRIDTCIYFQRFDQALRYTQNARTLFPDDLSLRVLKGRLLRQLQRLSASQRHLEILLARHPGDPTILRELSVTCRMLGDDRRCLDLGEQVLAVQPDHRGALVAQIDSCLHFRLPERALAWLEIARQRLPGDAGLELKQAAILRKLQRPTEAERLMTAYLTRYPGDLLARLELAISSRMAGNYTASLQHSAAILAIEPAHRAAHMARIDTAVYFQLHDLALQFVETALERLPAASGPLLKKGVVLRRLQRHADSIAWLREQSAAQPDNALVLQELAQSLRMAGNYAEARQLFDRLLQAQPYHREARMARIDIAIHLADLVVLEQECDHALRDLGAAASTSSDARQELAAHLLARALVGLPPTLARQRLASSRAPLLAVAERLPGSQLWALYELANFLGLGEDYQPCLDLLLQRPVIGLTEARRLLTRAFQLDLPGWQSLATRLGPRIPESDRTLFDLDYRALTLGAAAALSGRPRHTGRPRGVAEIQLISRLLQQTGQTRLAARYLRLAARARPDNRPLFREHVIVCIGLGRIAETLILIRARLANEPDPAPQWLGTLAFCMAELGELPAARALFDRITHPQLRAEMQHWHIRLLHGLGDSAAAAAAVQDYRNRTGQKQAMHFLPTLSGLLETDAAITGLASETAEAAGAALIVPALAAISAWQRAGAPASGQGAAVPRQIMQYWDTPEPPPEIRPIMRSWQQAPGFRYSRFDREVARQYLFRNLGEDWVRALRNAGSPAEESDYFRLCHLMLEGGIYADCDDWLHGDPVDLLRPGAGLVLFQEPFGTLANNVMIAAPHHPVLVWSAAAARRALLERHNDSPWAKTGPGLLTRAVAWYLDQVQIAGKPADLVLVARGDLGRVVQYHTPLPYKRTKTYWKAQNLPGGLEGLAADSIDRNQRRVNRARPVFVESD